MDRSTPIRPRPPPCGGGGRGPPPPLQQHLNPHARAWTPPTLPMRPQYHHPHQQQQHSVPTSIVLLESIVVKTWRDFIAAGASVSSWKLSQAAVLALQVESWSSLGISMQQVPSLWSLMAVEGKIDSFIHCFVETRKIVSLYDLEGALCENEGIERFEDLEMGPFPRYPLVMHYFSLNSDVTEVFKITSGEIVWHLGKFLSKRKSREGIEIGDLLSFIAKKKSVSEVEKLGVRIQSLGCLVNFVTHSKKLEATYLMSYLNLSSDDEDSDDLLNEDNKPADHCSRDEKSGQVMLVDASASSQMIGIENLSYAEWLKRDTEERYKILTDGTNFKKNGRKKTGTN